MGDGIRGLVAKPMARAVAGAILAGLVVLTMTLIWQIRRQPTVIVSIQQIDDPGIVRVYVGGAVQRPGVVTLPRGSRVADAIDAAGGVTEQADTATLGMAAMLSDSDQVIVASIALAPAPSAMTASPEQTESTPTARSGGAESVTPTVPSLISAPPAGGTALIDLNTASIEELDTLPGIGPTIAQRIIDYRTTDGPFQTVDELEGIRGISARMVDEMRALVTVGT